MEQSSIDSWVECLRILAMEESSIDSWIECLRISALARMMANMIHTQLQVKMMINWTVMEGDRLQSMH